MIQKLPILSFFIACSAILSAGSTSDIALTASVQTITAVALASSSVTIDGFSQYDTGSELILRAEKTLSSELSALTNHPDTVGAKVLYVHANTIPTSHTVRLWISGGVENIGTIGGATIDASSEGSAVTLSSTASSSIISSMREYSLSQADLTYQVDVPYTVAAGTRNMTVTFSYTAL